MKAVILAGGAGTRLRKVISDIPKPMAPVAGKPFLEYLILYLKQWTIKDIVLSVGYMSKSIQAYFDDGKKWGVSISYCIEDFPLGTGGAIKKASQLFSDANFLVFNGDSFFDCDLESLILYHDANESLLTLALAEIGDAGRYGKVDLTPEGSVGRFIEKGEGGCGLINCGIYVCNRKIVNSIPEGKASFEREIMPQLIGSGMYGRVCKGFFVDIGVPKDYQDICKDPRKILKLTDQN